MNEVTIGLDEFARRFASSQRNPLVGYKTVVGITMSNSLAQRIARLNGHLVIFLLAILVFLYKVPINIYHTCELRGWVGTRQIVRTVVVDLYDQPAYGGGRNYTAYCAKLAPIPAVIPTKYRELKMSHDQWSLLHRGDEVEIADIGDGHVYAAGRLLFVENEISNRSIAFDGVLIVVLFVLGVAVVRTIYKRICAEQSSVGAANPAALAAYLRKPPLGIMELKNE